MQSFLPSFAVPSNHQSVRLFYSLIPSYLTFFAADSQKDPFNDDFLWFEIVNPC